MGVGVGARVRAHLVADGVGAVLVVRDVARHLVLLHVRVELLDERLRRPDGDGELVARETAPVAVRVLGRDRELAPGEGEDEGAGEG